MKKRKNIKNIGKRCFVCLFALLFCGFAFFPFAFESNDASALGIGNYFDDTTLYDPLGHGELYVLDDTHTQGEDDDIAYFFTPLNYSLSLSNYSSGANEYVQTNGGTSTLYKLLIDDSDYTEDPTSPHRPFIRHITSGSKMNYNTRYFYGYVIRNTYVDVVSLYNVLSTASWKITYPFAAGDVVSVFLRFRVLDPAGGHVNIFGGDDVNVSFTMGTTSSWSTGMQPIFGGAQWRDLYPVSSIPRCDGRIDFVESFEIAFHYSSVYSGAGAVPLSTEFSYRLNDEVSAFAYQTAVNTAFKTVSHDQSILGALYSVVEDFFSIEIFPGFYLVFLLLMALGMCLFAFVLRIFIR